MDGKISTECGHSKWIGNDENLIHAHRLRAIVDGILVGANTVKNDKPKLNVRLVSGEDPIRLILSNKTKSFCNLSQNSNTKTFLLRHESHSLDCKEFNFDKEIYFKGDSDKERIQDVLDNLSKNGINSILIEGGSQTISCFTSTGLVDTIQLHIAPLILGSGKSFINLPGISKIQDGMFVKNARYEHIGDSIMITGNL